MSDYGVIYETVKDGEDPHVILTFEGGITVTASIKLEGECLPLFEGNSEEIDEDYAKALVESSILRRISDALNR